MAIDTAWLKAHWYYVAGALIGLLVLYEVLQSLSAGSSASSSSGADLSGSANQLASLSASADLENAQVNGQVETSAYQAEVADNQTAAALQLGEVQTAAELNATNTQTTAAENVALGESADLVQAQQIVTNGQVQETQIEGNTITTLGGQQESVQKSLISTVASQISNIQQYSKNAGSDYQKIAPIIGEELGEPSASAAASAANASEAATSQSGINTGITALAGVINTGTQAFAKIAPALFGGG